MKTWCIWLLLSIPLLLSAQNERKVIREGVRAYEEGNFSEAEVQFRKAKDLNAESAEASFNTGTALYNQEKYQETVKEYQAMVDGANDPLTEAKVWHNMGNSLLKAEQYGPSVEAFKKSLRLNPDDMDTKYNLAYAKKKLQEQQQQQDQDQQQQDQDQQQQDQDQQQQDQDQQQQDQDQQQQDQDQQQQDQDQQQQDRDQQQQDQETQEGEERRQPRPQEISREDAERMLNAIQQQEKEVKEKVDQKKAVSSRVKTEKDW